MFIERILPAARERLVTIADDVLLIEAAGRLEDRRTGLVVVCNRNGAMVGVVSKRDIVREISHCRGSSCLTAVATTMTKTVVYCRPGMLLRDVWSMMKEHELQHIPLVDEHCRPLGLITVWDVVLSLLEASEHEESLLLDYVTGVGYQ
jgi:CBS domain-containing protein